MDQELSTWERAWAYFRTNWVGQSHAKGDRIGVGSFVTPVLGIDSAGAIRALVNTSGQVPASLDSGTGATVSLTAETQLDGKRATQLYSRTISAVDSSDNNGAAYTLRTRGNLWALVSITTTGSPTAVSLRLALEDNDGTSTNWFLIRRLADDATTTGTTHILIGVSQAAGLTTETPTASDLSAANAPGASRTGFALGRRIRFSTRLATLTGGTSPAVAVTTYLVEA